MVITLSFNVWGRYWLHSPIASFVAIFLSLSNLFSANVSPICEEDWLVVASKVCFNEVFNFFPLFWANFRCASSAALRISSKSTDFLVGLSFGLRFSMDSPFERNSLSESVLAWEPAAGFKQVCLNSFPTKEITCQGKKGSLFMEWLSKYFHMEKLDIHWSNHVRQERNVLVKLLFYNEKFILTCHSFCGENVLD